MSASPVRSLFQVSLWAHWPDRQELLWLPQTSSGQAGCANSGKFFTQLVPNWKSAAIDGNGWCSMEKACVFFPATQLVGAKKGLKNSPNFSFLS